MVKSAECPLLLKKIRNDDKRRELNWNNKIVTISRALIYFIGCILETMFALFFTYLIIVLIGGIFSVGQLAKNGEVEIYVHSYGLHTDVVLPSNTAEMNWLDFIPLDDFRESRFHEYISIGWGDRAFFIETPLWSDVTFEVAFEAAFLPTPAAMHVMYSNRPSLSNDVKKVYISKANYRKMISYIKKSFKVKNGKIDLIENSGYTPRDTFYEANYSYHCFHTCNSWTNNLMKVAGVKTGVFALMPFGILNHLEID